jgi:hypothetical protein
MTDTYRASMEQLVGLDTRAVQALNTPSGSAALIRQAPLRAPGLG